MPCCRFFPDGQEDQRGQQAAWQHQGAPAVHAPLEAPCGARTPSSGTWRSASLKSSGRCSCGSPP
eukprot:3784399-Pyramimonas_sp.AAC.1